MKPERREAPPKTGWPPGMLQDDCRELSIWLSTRLDAKYRFIQMMKEKSNDPHRRLPNR